MHIQPESLLDHFTQASFSFTLRGWKEPVEAFFAPTPDHAAILAERRFWLEANPERHQVWLPQAAELVREAAELLGGFDPLIQPAPALPLEAQLYALGTSFEPDLVLCSPDSGGRFCMLAGSVCFPSYWFPEEKIGLPVEAVHAPVPGLNPALGGKIHNLLERLPSGYTWLRVNWGLSASLERNQHPLRGLPRLGATTPLEDIYLRIEHQALVRLPRSGGILFGIQPYSFTLDEVRRKPASARAIAGQMRSMPQDMQGYKGIREVSGRVVRCLEEAL
jgi:hypothetical protein